MMAERRAWVVVWVAFATFCVLVLSVVRFAIDYVSTADIDLSARVEASRGDVEVRRPGGPTALWNPADSEVPVGTTLGARRGASIRLRFFDGSRLTAQNDARVELARMDVGRFINRQTLVVKQTAGPARYETGGEVQVSVPHGLVRLNGGDATVWVEDNQTRVLVYQGEVRLESGGSSLLIPAGKRGVLAADRRPQGPDDRAQDLLVNGDFAKREEGWDRIDKQEGPKDVDGERIWRTGPSVAGVPLPALRIVRDSVANAHGETGLVQMLDKNVSGFRRLFLEAWVRVDYASLSGGGQVGSEYPLILHLEYEGPQPNSRPDWVRGFFTENPENRPVRNAEQVPAGQWVFYRSPNLMEQDEASRPFLLRRLEVVGQGHSYDSQVAGIQLVGD